MRRLIAALLLAPAIALCDSPRPVSYEKEVAPILRTYCAGCHNDQELEAELSVETFVQLRKGGEDHGDPILPGDADGSFLIKAIERRARPHMPPKDEPPVPAHELSILRRWIHEGARGPEQDTSILRTLITSRVAPAKVPYPVTAMAVSADGTLVALGRVSRLEIHDSGITNEARLTITDLPGKISAVHFSADHRQVIAATGVAGLFGEARLYSLDTGSVMRVFGQHRDLLYDAELSPDGTLLATAGYDRVIHIWRVETGELLRSIDVHKAAVFDLAWHPSGNVLASASADETIKLWRVRDGMRLDTLNQPNGELKTVLFTADGEYIIAAGNDKRIHLWRFISRDAPALNPPVHSRFAHESPISALALTADGRYLLSSADDRSLKLWTVPGLDLCHAYSPQPDIVDTAAPASGNAGFLVGRMDGSIEQIPIVVTISSASEAKPDTSATPVTEGKLASGTIKAVELEPNEEPAAANSIQLPAEVSGSISRPGDRDVFRFHSGAGEVLRFEISAARAKSKLDSRIEVLHADGTPVEQVVLQAMRDSWFTFRGKDSETSEDFRLQNWAEMELDEYLYSNGEVVRLWMYPRGPDSGFKVYPGEGKRHTYFATTALTHALGEPCYIVRPLPAGSHPAPNGLPVYRLGYVNDDDPTRAFGTDSVLTFVTPAEGDYLVRVTDVRGFGDSSNYHYTLAVRAPRPDFRITIGGMGPKVSPGSGREITFKAQRLEGFDEAIRIDIDGLPPGFSSSSPIEIEAGQYSAVGVLYAASDAADPDDSADQAVKLTARAVSSASSLKHELGSLGNIQLGTAPKVTVEILPAADRTEVAKAAAGPLEFSVRPGETIKASVKATRHDFTSQIELGNEDSGRNLPYGVYVDNIGLNGLLIVQGQNEREFSITASPVARPGRRLFHLRALADGGQASHPVLLHVLERSDLAAH